MDRTFSETLKTLFTAAIGKAYPDLASEKAEVAQSSNSKFGHYQCNSAMRLAKLLKTNPREVAQALVDAVEKDDVIEGLEIAGPGFINITLKSDFLADQVRAILDSPRAGVPEVAHPQRVIVEFSSPNIAKEMHVGHLRSTILGESLARLLEFLGHDVVRLNHVGDWGTQFGMLIAFLKDEAPGVLTGDQTVDLTQLVTWYKAAKKRFDEDADFKKRSRLEVVALQGGDSNSRHAWEKLCQISRVAFEEIYHILDATLTERGESTYNPDLPKIVEDLDEKGLLVIDDEARCVHLEGFTNRSGNPLPLIVQKADGGYNYATTDLAALRQRVSVEKADRIIYVVDMGQATHFKMVFQAAAKAGYYDPAKTEVNHVPFGLVCGDDGKKFRTRAGETERLIDLLQVAIDKARAVVQERTTDFSSEEIEEIAKAVGIGAVKYSDLSSQRIKDYIFSYDRMLKFEGNTAPFILYSYVRIAGIKRKAGKGVDLSAKLILDHPSEIALGLHLCRFGEVLAKIERDLMPHHLAEYLYSLAEHFNAFFRDCRVVDAPEEASRLLLCEAAAHVMRAALHILAIRPLEKM